MLRVHATVLDSHRRVFSGLGFSLFAARLAPLATVTIVLLLTHLVGTRYLSPGHGFLRDFHHANVRPDAAFHDLAGAMQNWLEARGEWLGVVEDPTYGRVEVYAIKMDLRS